MEVKFDDTPLKGQTSKYIQLWKTIEDMPCDKWGYVELDTKDEGEVLRTLMYQKFVRAEFKIQTRNQVKQSGKFFFRKVAR
ncbi:hypothetical protein KC887_04865 [Candidatus Kaiserbacteria bacterium]|nr:hypothetical protein [Candidatus Kaiserbacteria bacterium]